MISESFVCRRGALNIRGQYCVPGGKERVGQAYPAVFLCHGFGGHGNQMEPYARFLCEMGYACFWFDFCGGCLEGSSDGSQEALSLSSECADLNAVMDYAVRLPFVDGARLTLLGGSMGGAVAAMVAAQGKRAVENLVLLSPAFCIPDDARAGHLGGATYDVEHVPDLIACPGGMRVSRAFHEEMCALDIWESIRGYHGRVLLHHGYADEVVPFAYAQKAKRVYGDACELHLVQQVRHGMDDAQRQNALAVLRQFMLGRREYLNITVQITDTAIEPGLTADERVCAIRFTGYCDGPAFWGAIEPGAVDRRISVAGREISVRAEYALQGVDAQGRRCRVRVVNQEKNGEWKPAVETDSPCLAPLKQDATAVLEGFPGGLNVRIFA